MCYPEFRLPVPNCFHSLDVLGLGEEPCLEPVQHFVLDEGKSHSLMKRAKPPMTLDLESLPNGWEVVDKVARFVKPLVKSKVSSAIIRSWFQFNF